MRKIGPLVVIGGALLTGGVLALALAGGGGSRYPQGKGVFIEGLIKQGKNPAYLIERLVYMGIKWIAIEIAWFGTPSDGFSPPSSYGPDGNVHNLEDGALASFTPALVEAGIDVWVWGFPSPDRQDRFVEYVADAYRVAPQISGVILDPEKPYYGSEHQAALEDLISRCQALGKPVGVTTYGSPKYHPKFPYEAIAMADFGVPQIYSRLGEDYPANADDEWRALGISPIIPLNGASSKHSASNMADQARWSDTSDGGIGWWNYRHLMQSGARANAVRDFDDWGGDG